MNDYSIVTVSDKKPIQDYYCYDSFFKSLSKYGIEPLVLTGFKGLNTKPREVLRAINDGRIDSEILIICDSWDLVFQRPVAELVEKFKRENIPVIISSEINCFPVDYKAELDLIADVNPLAHNYINSGFIIGYTGEIKKMLDAMGADNYLDDYHDGNGWHHFNDQTSYMKVFCEQPIQIKLDRYSDYSISIYGMDDTDFEMTELNGKPIIKNKKTDNYPFCIHWNGGAKSMNAMKPILNYLNLI